MKAKEVAKLLANRINQEHYILYYMDKLYKAGYKAGIPHPIRQHHLIELEALYAESKITHSRMVEILNEIEAGGHKNGIEI